MKKSIIAIIAFIIGVIGYGGAQTLGYSGEQSTKRVDVYGTILATTTASTTSDIIAVGPDYNKVNLNIKTTSTLAQTIAIVPEFSNENNCDTVTTWFRETNNSATAGAIAVATTTRTIQVPAGAFNQSVQITDLNARCIKLTFNTSSTTDPAMLWVEGYFSN